MTTRLDDQTADRLLGGLVAPEDAPPGFAAIAVLVRGARGPATDEELTAVPFVASARVPRSAGGPSRVAPFESPRRRRGGVAVRVVLVAAVIGFGTTAAAASQGKLPDPAQRAVSKVAEHVGWHVPSPDDPAPPGNIEQGEVPGPTGAIHPAVPALPVAAGTPGVGSPDASSSPAADGSSGSSSADQAPDVTPPSNPPSGRSARESPSAVQGNPTPADSASNAVPGSSAVDDPPPPAASSANPPGTTSAPAGAGTTTPPDEPPTTTAADGGRANGKDKDPSKPGNPTPGVPPTAPPGNGNANGFGNGNANGKTKP